MGQEQTYANQRITTIVQLGIDNSTIALATDNCIDLLHLSDNIHLANSRSIISATVPACYITQSARRAKVRNGITARLRQYVVSNRNQSILLTKHHAILANQSQTVNIGIDNYTQVCLLAYDNLRNFGQVLGQRLGIVRKLTIGVTVELDNLATHTTQQLGNSRTTHRIDSVYDNLKILLGNSLNINQRQCQHHIDVSEIEVLACYNTTNVVNIGELIVGLFGKSKHLLTIFVGQELATSIEQLQRIPLLGIVRSGDDNTTIGLMRSDCHLDTRSGTEIDIDNISTATDQRALNQAHNHLTRDAGITTYDDLNALFATAFLDETRVSYCILYDIDRSKVFTLNATDCAANTRDRFN